MNAIETLRPMSKGTYGLVIVGAGPAGLAPLLAAAKAGSLGEVLERGVFLVDRAAHAGAGRIGNYIIRSDSSAETFVSCVRDCPVPELAALAETEIARDIAEKGAGCIPLEQAGRFLAMVGRVLADLIAASPRGRVALRTEVRELQKQPDGSWIATLESHAGDRREHVRCLTALVATGANQDRERLRHIPVGGRPLLPACDARLVQSDEFLSHDGFRRAMARLAGKETPRIAIVGGSTSAMSCAKYALEALGDRAMPGAITLLHRRPLSVFYHSREAAAADGYEAFDDDDICPVSGFVHRFGGFRFDSRELIKQILGINVAAVEKRIVCQRIVDGTDHAVRETLEQADLVIACLGYRPAGVALRDVDGLPITLRSEVADAPMVNPACGLLDSDGVEIGGLYGIGLAAGYRPPPEMGGERSFSGQVNGLWLWQNDVGRLAITRVLTTIRRFDHASRSVAA
ncbi:DegT/DnrJ/EryC1/StrS aminotransferase [Neoasaia chiangmaiensis NBRC 101099]|uniref:Uncharacterized protein n=1 Tax=Neoasaia chiangmaiensis TaxID=320497 RepID=A0A1U9KSN8_9PROT|nr:FAD-dependent oxidoreductase [Neoasaia chiangmaiensis]AQS88739.1 hypothetical protein A0U93_13340 [Neoasaia chiangmaiensis]GBR40890.1 DegT/DnrJ/EryC1/StrS aminotransferase [Neoasaia chiangmaiensis NBRC 101099]GEN13698.1 hypothetical protein NCH01_01290 [Neoasaia chiangmaiensis]